MNILNFFFSSNRNQTNSESPGTAEMEDDQESTSELLAMAPKKAARWKVTKNVEPPIFLTTLMLSKMIAKQPFLPHLNIRKLVMNTT